MIPTIIFNNKPYSPLEKLIATKNPETAKKMYEKRTGVTTTPTPTQTPAVSNTPVQFAQMKPVTPLDIIISNIKTQATATPSTTTTTTTPKPPTVAPTPTPFKFQTPLDRLLANLPKTTTTTTKKVDTAPTFQQYDNQMPVREFSKFLSGKLSESELRENQANTINPSAMYRVGTAVVPGFVVKKQITASEDKYQGSLKSEIATVSKYDPRYLVSSTVRGFEFKLDTGIESRKRIAEYDAMNKIVPDSGEGMKFLYGIEGSIESLTTGLVSLFMEKVVTPIHSVISPGTEKSDKDFIQGINSVAVPSVWTPEGREILGKLGLPGYAGTITGEALQFYVGGKVISPIVGFGASELKLGSRAILTSPVIKGVSKYAPSAIKESPVVTNFEKWAIEGYKPGKALIEVPTVTTVKQGTNWERVTQEFALKPDKTVGVLDKRIWLTPAEQLDYTTRLEGQGTIGGSLSIRPLGKYSEQFTFGLDKETFNKSLSGAIKGRTADTFLFEKPLGWELGTSKGEAMGFTRTWDAFDKNAARILANTDRNVYFNSGTLLSELELSDVTKSPFLTMMEEGYSRTRPLITGTKNLTGNQALKDIVGGYYRDNPLKTLLESDVRIDKEYFTGSVNRLEAYPGWGVQTAPLSEKAIWGLRKPGILSEEAWSNFLKDTRGTMTETIHITKPTSIFSGGGGFSRELRSLSTVSMNVPSDVMGKGLATGFYSASLYGLGEIKSTQQKPDVIMNQIVGNTTIPKSIQIPQSIQVPDYIQNTISSQRNIQLPTQDVMQVSLQDVAQYPLQKQVSIQDQMQKQIQKTIQEQVQIQEPMQMQEQRQNYKQVQGQKQIRILAFDLPTTTMDKKLSKLLRGYDVFVKERHYFKGKKKKPTTWFKANQYPLTREQALGLGGTAVEHTAAASFKILPTEGQPRNLGFGVSNWDTLSNQFYEKNGVLIERTAHRINTPGEIKGISALGWLRQKELTRLGAAPTQTKYKPMKEVKPSKINTNIQPVNIKKLMKKWKL